MSDKATDFAIPEGLSAKGREAAEAIIKFLEANGADDAGGCKVFYTPKEWADRDEEYGLKSELVVVHDGGDHAGAFNYSYEQYDLIDGLLETLEPLGLYAEQCTCWYSAIYCR